MPDSKSSTSIHRTGLLRRGKGSPWCGTGSSGQRMGSGADEGDVGCDREMGISYKKNFVCKKGRRCARMKTPVTVKVWFSS